MKLILIITEALEFHLAQLCIWWELQVEMRECWYWVSSSLEKIIMMLPKNMLYISLY